MPQLLAQALHSQVDMHQAYGGVVPELASRDHIRRVLPLTRQVLADAGCSLQDIDLVAYTRGPGLAGALLVGAGVAVALAAALGRPTLGVHHLEGHLLSPFLSADPPQFPFVALLVSGGHTQLMRVDDVGRYALLGETIDDAAGEAFDKSAKLLGLGYPGGPALSRAGRHGRRRRLRAAAAAAAQPQPRLLLRRAEDRGGCAHGASCGAALSDAAARRHGGQRAGGHRRRAGARSRCVRCRPRGLQRLVVAGGVGANASLRERLDAACRARRRARALSRSWRCAPTTAR